MKCVNYKCINMKKLYKNALMGLEFSWREKKKCQNLLFEKGKKCSDLQKAFDVNGLQNNCTRKTAAVNEIHS